MHGNDAIMTAVVRTLLAEAVPLSSYLSTKGIRHALPFTQFDGVLPSCKIRSSESVPHSPCSRSSLQSKLDAISVELASFIHSTRTTCLIMGSRHCETRMAFTLYIVLVILRSLRARDENQIYFYFYISSQDPRAKRSSRGKRQEEASQRAP